MDDKELEIRQKLKRDFPHFASRCLKIRPKDMQIEPLVLNKAQLYLHQRLEEQKKETGMVRAVVLKGRQQGCSTYIEGRFYWLVSHMFGARAFILTHEDEATTNLFEIAQRYHEFNNPLVKPITGSSSAKELHFAELDSGYKVGTAGNKTVGRSATIQLFHGSEVAFWPNAEEHAKGVMQAIPTLPGTESILESTANGLGNYYHQQWQKAEAEKGDYIAIFLPWFWQDEYRRLTTKDFVATDEEIELKQLYNLDDQQLMWRRLKIEEFTGKADGLNSFMQEYPCNPTEAFQMSGENSYISSSVVMRARKCESAPQVGALVVGVDPARFGDDRTSIIRRHGRVSYKLESHFKKDTMEVTGICHLIIKNEKPVKMFIDVGGLGAAVYDRLVEMGHGDIVVAVNFGGKPLDAARYSNKRCEMWGEMRDWLNEQPCKIPDSDTLHADLCAPQYKFDSVTRLVLERKEDIKKRGLRSPDEGDALALTFAYPVATLSSKKLVYPSLGIV